MKKLFVSLTLICAAATSAHAQTVPVTVENFIRAESDRYFAPIALKRGGFGKFTHARAT
jgi:hypothetical protein